MQLAFWKRPAAPEPEAELLIAALYDSLSEAQRREVCQPWDHADERRGLVRSFIANHWQVTRPCVASDFFSPAQQSGIFEIFKCLLNPNWRSRVMQALKDDTKGHRWGQDQSIGFLGTPDHGPWQFLFTGRHLTLRVQSPGASDLACGAPLIYGHAAEGAYHERPGHPGNVFWPQAIAANRVYELLDGATRARAEVDELPREHEISFRAQPDGVRVAAMPRKAATAFKKLLHVLIEPYREADRNRFMTCLTAQGGLKNLHLAFARTPRISAPLFDVWRIEGPAFVWHFQGWPHVHGWVHVASTPRAGSTNAHHGAFLFPGHDELR